MQFKNSRLRETGPIIQGNHLLPQKPVILVVADEECTTQACNPSRGPLPEKWPGRFSPTGTLDSLKIREKTDYIFFLPQLYYGSMPWANTN